MKEVGKTRNSGFDLLRIVAMGGVILIHSTIYLPIPNIVLPFFMWGGAGVQIFFVLSACLAGESFYKYNCETKCYYIKRCKKILPSYYMAILLAMIYQICVQENNLQDIYHLKWIRYFLGLNTILPSNDYDMWNNLYGFWTMSAFIYFYVVVPVIFKLVKSVKQAVFFFAMSFGISLVWKVIINYGFGKITGLEELNVLSGASPFGVLYQFAIGIIVFCVIKQECENIGNIILSIVPIR